MAKLRELHLESFSHTVACRLLKEFPSLAPYIGREEREERGLTVYVLQLRIPSANPAITEPLEINTELDGTIYAYWFHLSERYRWNIDWVYYLLAPHFGDHSSQPWQADPAGIDHFVEWLHAFLNEELVTHYNVTKGSVGGGGYCVPEDASSFLRFSDEVVVRSWRGTHDRIFPHAASSQTPNAELPQTGVDKPKPTE